jgi:hypothetical protein
MVAKEIKKLNLLNGDECEVDFLTGSIRRIKTDETIMGSPFSNIQMDIYHRGGLLKPEG